jgi:hypothetical protein
MREKERKGIPHVPRSASTCSCYLLGFLAAAARVHSEPFAATSCQCLALGSVAVALRASALPLTQLSRRREELCNPIRYDIQVHNQTDTSIKEMRDVEMTCVNELRMTATENPLDKQTHIHTYLLAPAASPLEDTFLIQAKAKRSQIESAGRRARNPSGRVPVGRHAERICTRMAYRRCGRQAHPVRRV